MQEAVGGSSPPIPTMAKNKEDEALYKAEGQKRIRQRKTKRREAFHRKRELYKKLNSCNCGSDYYCYCGDGSPYSY